MKFNISQSLQILERTPAVVETMLSGLDDEWIMNNEGPGTWSCYDIVGHYIHGEKTDWMPRMQVILHDSGDKKFTPFDRFAQYQDSKGKSLPQLIAVFKTLREENIRILRSLTFSEALLNKTGIHPHFGVVTLRQLLSTWVVHDLNHIYQMNRVLSKQYKEEVGPWVEFLGVLQ